MNSFPAQNLLSLLIVVVAFFQGCLTPTEHLTTYKVSVHDTLSRVVDVEIDLVARDTLLYMYSGGSSLEDRWATFVKNLKVTNSKNENVSIEYLGDAQWRMDVIIGEKLTVSYQVYVNHEDYEWSGGVDGAAYVTELGIFLTGRSLFLFNGESSSPSYINFDLPNSWTVSSPWEIVDNQQSFQAFSQDDMAMGLMFLGTHEEVLLKNDSFDLIFALGSNDIVSQSSEYKKLAGGVLNYYKSKMNGLPKPPPSNPFRKSIVVLSSSEKTDGEALGSNISVLIGNNEELLSRFIFAHEFFHLWNGKSFFPNTDEMEWFKEGFTNYYTLKALSNIGCMDEESVLGILGNLMATRYLSDPGLGEIPLTNGEAKHDHWGLIYAGGMFVAMKLEMQLIRDGFDTFDDVMKVLFEKYGGTDNGYSLKELEDLFEKAGVKNSHSFFKNYIYGTKTIDLKSLFGEMGIEFNIDKEGEVTLLKRTNQSSSEQMLFNRILGF